MPCMVVHAWPCCCCAPAPKRGRSDRSASESRGETTGERHDATAGAPRQIGWACARVGLARETTTEGMHRRPCDRPGDPRATNHPHLFLRVSPLTIHGPRPRRPAGPRHAMHAMHGRAPPGSCHAVDFGPPPPALCHARPCLACCIGYQPRFFLLITSLDRSTVLARV